MKKGGKNNRKGKRGGHTSSNNAMVYRETDTDAEQYAIVTKMLGQGRLHVMLPDSSTKLAIIPGKMRRRRFWINVNDILLVYKPEYENDKCHVLHKYNKDQIQLLKKTSGSAGLNSMFLNRLVNKTGKADEDVGSDEHFIDFVDETESDGEKESKDTKTKCDTTRDASLNTHLIDSTTAPNPSATPADEYEFDWDTL